MLWTVAALAALAAALILGFGVAILYSARFLSGITPALGLVLLQVGQVALGVAAASSTGERHWPVTFAAGVSLLGGYAAVALLLPPVIGQWMFVVPPVPLLLAEAGTLLLVLGQRRVAKVGRSSQDR